MLEPLGVVRRRPEDGHERASGQRELRLGSTSEIHTGKEAVSGPGMAKPLGGGSRGGIRVDVQRHPLNVANVEKRAG